MENDITRLFVYGSLRSGFHHPAYDYISKYFTLISEAKVKGYLYDMGDYPAGMPTGDEAFIAGELYDLKQSADYSWAMEQLDAYEGVHPAEGEEQLYKREPAEVFYNGQKTQAWIYWFNKDLTGRPIISSGDVLEFIHQKSKL